MQNLDKKIDSEESLLEVIGGENIKVVGFFFLILSILLLKVYPQN